MRKKHTPDQADAVIRVNLPAGDFDAALAAVRKADDDAIELIERLNAEREGHQRLRSPFEIAVLDADGNRMLVVPPSGEPEMRPDELLADVSDLPRFSYVVATDARGQRIVVRIEYQRAMLQ